MIELCKDHLKIGNNYFSLRNIKLFRFSYCGKKVSIGKHCIISFPTRIHLGDFAFIAPFAYLSGKGGIRIGRGVMIGPRVTILSSHHNYDTRIDFVPYSSKDIESPVDIYDGAWIGANSIIMPGVTIGVGAVVGAGSLVLKDIPDYAVAFGWPAEIRKFRNNIEDFDELMRNEKFLLNR